MRFHEPGSSGDLHLEASPKRQSAPSGEEARQAMVKTQDYASQDFDRRCDYHHDLQQRIVIIIIIIIMFWIVWT